MSRHQRARRLRQALARALLQGHGRREAHLDLRHGAEERREADDRVGARPGRRATRRSPPRCSASTATRCARRCSSCGSRVVPTESQQALLSVSDKTGIVELARGARRARRRADLHRRHREAAAEGRHRGHRGVGATPAFRDARRPGEDAAPEDPRRPARAPRRSGAPGGDRRAPASRRSTWWWSTCIPFEATVADPTAASRTRSRTSTSAARRCCARRRRTTPASRWWSIPRTTRACSRRSQRPAAYRDATRFALAQQGVRAHRRLRRRDRNYLTRSTPSASALRVSRTCSTCSCASSQDLRYGENPHQSGGVLPRRAAGRRQPRRLPPAAGQGALLQQHRRRRRGVGMREELRRAGLRDRQARQSVRRRDRREPRSRRTQGVRDRSDVGVRRHPRLQPRARRAPRPRRSAKQFVEVVIAPRVEPEAQQVFAKKANVRVLEVPLAHERAGARLQARRRRPAGADAATRSVLDARGLQGRDARSSPSAAQLADLLFAWRVAKYVKSNAIVFCGDGTTLGVGAGQMSRVDSARIAAIKAQKAGPRRSQGSVVASDAFFPFRDGARRRRRRRRHARSSSPAAACATTK